MQMETTNSNRWQIVTLTEKNLDAANSEDFKTTMEEKVKNNPHVILDLENVEFLDSSGCGALLSVFRLAGMHGGEFKLCGVRETVESLFDLLKLNQVIDVYKTREAAVAGN